ncbi:hypothetical protein EV702DRAFT_1043385 [Suillus placidus]|uniref:Uncharacterized protein n=1 Tax=Suillus placidus TaxID=48579 RepID=A0A9P7A1H9_9AGAM|nr:hypothetical protein EV702DRAFT_1043385 [Suillus placidus]
MPQIASEHRLGNSIQVLKVDGSKKTKTLVVIRAGTADEFGISTSILQWHLMFRCEDRYSSDDPSGLDGDITRGIPYRTVTRLGPILGYPLPHSAPRLLLPDIPPLSTFGITLASARLPNNLPTNRSTRSDSSFRNNSNPAQPVPVHIPTQKAVPAIASITKQPSDRKSDVEMSPPNERLRDGMGLRRDGGVHYRANDSIANITLYRVDDQTIFATQWEPIRTPSSRRLTYASKLHLELDHGMPSHDPRTYAVGDLAPSISRSSRPGHPSPPPSIEIHIVTGLFFGA